MGQIETIISLSRRIESVLEDKYGASGKGLHSKVSSVEDLLPRNEIKNIRYIATIRNNAVHEANFKVKDIKGFTQKAQRVLAVLDTHSKRNKTSIKKIHQAQGSPKRSGQSVIEQAAAVDKSKAKLSLMKYSDAELTSAAKRAKITKSILVVLILLAVALSAWVLLKDVLSSQGVSLNRIVPTNQSDSAGYESDIDDLLE